MTAHPHRTYAKFSKDGRRILWRYYEIRGPLCCQLDVGLNYEKEAELPRGTAE